MISSGMKRGLAATAISALAVSGIPALAGTASATPIANTLGTDAVKFYAPNVLGVSGKNDGTNTTVSLVTGGGSNVSSVLYQYMSTSSAGAWVDVPGGAVARNADGVFALDWSAPPADLLQVRAVPSTGEANAVSRAANTIPNVTANTVELASEGSRGVFQEPYSEGTYAATDSDLIGVTGTVSQGTGSVTVKDVSHTNKTATGTVEATDDTTSDDFQAILDVDGYTYSGGSEANQIAINAATNNTDDAEGSTLYVQTIGSITATPATQDQVDPTKSVINVTVLDTTGKPVAGAQVGVGADTDTDNAGPDTDTDGAEHILGYTDARGVYSDTTETAATTFKYFVNTTDNDAYESAIDPSTSATVTTYTPVLTTVDIVNNRSRSNFDIDELSDNDDFTIKTLDQKGAGVAATSIEYRLVIDPAATGADTYTSAWIPATTDANGKYNVPGLTETSYNGAPVPPGSITIEARHPNVNGTGLINAAPETYTEGESEITFDEGANENATVEGDTTLHGNLALTGGGASLAGRIVTVTFNSREDAKFVATDGTTVSLDGLTATATTDANGNFTVKVDDQAGPANVPDNPETDVINAIADHEARVDANTLDATSLQGNLGTDNGSNDTEAPSAASRAANAEAEITLNFDTPPAVSRVEVDMDELLSVAGPGEPVDFDVTVRGKDSDTNPNNDPVLTDFPVSVTVDKGFLSPNAETENDVTLAAGHDTAGDLWGFFKNDGTTKSYSTGDGGEAGFLAAIEKDAGFDDDGMVDGTVTIKAGDVTVTKSITWDSRSPLNLQGLSLERSSDAPANPVSTADEVPFQLYTHDQFGNLAGDQDFRISDDSTVADFRTDEDFDQTLSDFTTSGAGVVAFSDAATTQKLTATSQFAVENVVIADGDRDQNNKTYTTQSDEIVWVAAPTPQHHIHPGISAVHVPASDSIAGYDKITVNAGSAGADAVVSLYRVKDGVAKKVKSKVLGTDGKAIFKRADLNGDKFNYYFAKVSETAVNYRGRTDTIGVK